MIDMEKIHEAAEKDFARAAVDGLKIGLTLNYMAALEVFGLLQIFCLYAPEGTSIDRIEAMRNLAGQLQDALKISEATGIVLEMGWHDVDAITEYN